MVRRLGEARLHAVSSQGLEMAGALHEAESPPYLHFRRSGVGVSGLVSTGSSLDAGNVAC